MRHTKINCNKCEREFGSNVIKRHSMICEGLKECPVCKIKHNKKGLTCSYSCSNKMFRTGENNGNWKQDTYQSTCWLYHGKKCLVCGEEKIVAAHHVNEDHSDNRPENLVPLCPTHHQYVHSRYRDEVQPIIDKYLYEFNLRVA